LQQARQDSSSHLTSPHLSSSQLCAARQRISPNVISPCSSVRPRPLSVGWTFLPCPFQTAIALADGAPTFVYTQGDIYKSQSSFAEASCASIHGYIAPQRAPRITLAPLARHASLAPNAYGYLHDLIHRTLQSASHIITHHLCVAVLRGVRMVWDAANPDSRYGVQDQGRPGGNSDIPEHSQPTPPPRLINRAVINTQNGHFTRPNRPPKNPDNPVRKSLLFSFTFCILVTWPFAFPVSTRGNCNGHWL
jgi:hypothetical protein